MNHLNAGAGIEICCISFSAELSDIMHPTAYLVLKFALTRANVGLISDLPDALDFEAIAEAQKSDADIQSLCNRITSLQIKCFPVRNLPNFICDVC